MVDARVKRLSPCATTSNKRTRTNEHTFCGKRPEPQEQTQKKTRPRVCAKEVVRATTMNSLFQKLKQTVSRDKQRYVDAKFNLDLTYITERIVGARRVAPFVRCVACSRARLSHSFLFVLFLFCVYALSVACSCACAAPSATQRWRFPLRRARSSQPTATTSATFVFC